nr:putative secreted glycosidase [Quercus suber]
MWIRSLEAQTEASGEPKLFLENEALICVLGDVFPGATLPYGMAKAVADTDSDFAQGGFTTDGANITGFSSMHDSGTG